MGVSSEKSVVKGCRTMKTVRVSYQRRREASSGSFSIIVSCPPPLRGVRHMVSSVEGVKNRNKDTYYVLW